MRRYICQALHARLPAELRRGFVDPLHLALGPGASVLAQPLGAGGSLQGLVNAYLAQGQVGGQVNGRVIGRADGRAGEPAEEGGVRACVLAAVGWKYTDGGGQVVSRVACGKWQPSLAPRSLPALWPLLAAPR